MKNTHTSRSPLPIQLRSSEGDVLTLHRGVTPHVVVFIPDEQILLTIRSKACVALIQLTVAAGGAFELGGFWLEERTCHVPILLLSTASLGVTFAYAVDLLEKRHHTEFFRQFPMVHLLVQDTRIVRQEGSLQQVPLSLATFLSDSIATDIQRRPSTLALLSR